MSLPTISAETYVNIKRYEQDLANQGFRIEWSLDNKVAVFPISDDPEVQSLIVTDDFTQAVLYAKGYIRGLAEAAQANVEAV